MQKLRFFRIDKQIHEKSEFTKIPFSVFRTPFFRFPKWVAGACPRLPSLQHFFFERSEKKKCWRDYKKSVSFFTKFEKIVIFVKKLTLFIYPAAFFFSLKLKEKSGGMGGRGLPPLRPLSENRMRKTESEISLFDPTFLQ